MNNKFMSMAGYAVSCFFLVSSVGCSDDTDLSKLLAAADAIQNVAEELDNLEPSPYESNCLPLMEKQELIMESIDDALITESQRAELVDIFKHCYDAIQQEVKITTVEFTDLSTASTCLTKVHELSEGLSELEHSIEEFSIMPLAKKEENNAVKAAAGMLPLGIALVGGQVMINRTSICTMEKSGFNSELFSQE